MSELLSQYPSFSNEHPGGRFRGFLARKALRKTARKAISQTQGPLLEVGGPSPEGFSALRRDVLPNGLIISNAEPTKGASEIVDVRHLPYGPQSLGGILMRSLTRIPEEVARTSYRMDRYFWSMNFLLRDADKGKYDLWADKDILEFSQGIALLREARRTVEPGGVLITDTLFGGEIELAQDLGFNLLASTVGKINPEITSHNVGEFVFRLDELDTPAARAIETLPIGNYLE